MNFWVLVFKPGTPSSTRKLRHYVGAVLLDGAPVPGSRVDLETLDEFQPGEIAETAAGAQYKILYKL